MDSHSSKQSKTCISRLDIERTYQEKELLLFFGFLLIALGVLKPFEEGLGSLADFAADGQIDVALACFATPGFEYSLRDEVLLIVGEKDLRDLWDERRMLIANEALGTTEKSLFVLFGGDHLF